MKTKFFAALLGAFIWSVTFSFAQKLTFCEKADASGNPVNANTAFTISKNGGPVTLLFTPPLGMKLSSVNFDIYKIIDTKEVYQSSMKQPVTGAWVSKQVTLYDDGKYRVYVFDENDKQLAKGDLTIKR